MRDRRRHGHGASCCAGTGGGSTPGRKCRRWSSPPPCRSILQLRPGRGGTATIPQQFAYLMLTTVAVTTVAWLAVTLLTAPNRAKSSSRSTRRVRPAGPGWAPIAAWSPARRPADRKPGRAVRQLDPRLRADLRLALRHRQPDLQRLAPRRRASRPRPRLQAPSSPAT